VILLDTNVISELMRPQAESRVLAWANGLDPEAVSMTAMNEAEILHGLARLPDGRRKQQLQQSWDLLVAELFVGRFWPFTSKAAHWYGGCADRGHGTGPWRFSGHKKRGRLCRDRVGVDQSLGLALISI